MLSIEQAAEARGVTTKTIRRWVAAGILPAYRVGPKLLRVRPDDLDALSRRIPTASAS
jgi:excisionase family DNA binding protein